MGALEKCVTENNNAFQTACQQSAVKQMFTHIVKLMIKICFALRFFSSGVLFSVCERQRWPAVDSLCFQPSPRSMFPSYSMPSA